MFGRSVTLFRIFGFAVRIDVSWLVILALVIWSLAAGVFPEDPALGDQEWQVYLLMGLGGAFGLFASIVFHELCHSLVARQFGLPMEGITLFMFGGVAEMSDEPPSPKAEFMMAVAGPLASLVVAGVFLGMTALGHAWGWSVFVLPVLRWVGYINLILVGFNLIPGFPLDGGRILRSILWQWKHDLRRATDIAAQVGSGFGMALILIGFLNLLFFYALGGLWWILIGMFIRGAAKQAYQQVLIRQALQGESVSRFMNPEPVAVPPTLTLQDLVEDFIYRYHFKMFPVVEGEELQGCVTTRQVREVPRGEWARRTVGEVMEACSPDNTVSPQLDAMKSLSLMNRNQASRLLVAEGGQLAGILSLKDLLKFLSLKLELEAEQVEPSLDG